MFQFFKEQKLLFCYIKKPPILLGGL